MEIEKAEKIFLKIERLKDQKYKRTLKSSEVYPKAVDSIANTFFFFCAFFLLLIIVFSDFIFVQFPNLNINKGAIIFLAFGFSFLVSYFTFWKKAMKNIKRKKRWSQKIEELKTKKARLQEELNLVIEEKIDDYFIEIQELEKEDKLELLSEKFIDKIIETKKEKVLALTGRSNAIREVAILEKEVNEMNNNSFITNN